MNEYTSPIPLDATPVRIPIDATTPRAIGIINIVLGLLMMLCGAYTVVNALMLPFMAKAMEGMQAQIEADMQRQMQQAAQPAEDAAAEGTKAPDGEPDSDEDAAEGQAGDGPAAGPTLQSPPPIPMMDMGKFFQIFEDPALMAFTLIDGISGALLNLLLLISGVGLLGIKEWGRKLSLWLAGLKMVRLVLLYGVAIFVIAPLMGQAMGDMVDDMFAKMPPGGGQQPPPGTFATVYTTMITVTYVGMIVVGFVYPIITLLLLRRPRVLAAFQRQSASSSAAST